jgi:oligoribonuclease
MAESKKYLVWMDLEMTGLDPERERIIEMATLITDSDLNIIAEGPELVIHQPDSLLDAMDDWNKEHHGASGLIARVKASTISEADAEAQTLEFLKQYVGPRAVPLCGNSIGQDRRFLVKYMNTLNEHLHYRNVDVSTLKELVKRWYPESYQAPRKEASHRALDDIRESINELRWYRERVFVDATADALGAS